MSDYNDHPEPTTGKSTVEESSKATENRHSPGMVEKFVIRLPKGLRNKIRHLSEKNRRSMNSEIIMVLEKHIQQNMADSGKDLAQSEFNSGSPEIQDTAASAFSGPSDSELTKRLQDLPEEKKQALLELLG